MKKNKMKKGFTMAELLISLTILGVIAAILIPIIVQSAPNKNALRFKKAYLTTETVVYELINSNDYPDIDQGFSYITGYFTADKRRKFCDLFVEHVTTVGSPNCSYGRTPSNNSTSTTPNFTTSDGVQWYINTSGSNFRIILDVDGVDGPNNTTDTTNRRDRFTIDVTMKGKLSVPTGTSSSPSMEYKYLMMSDDEL